LGLGEIICFICFGPLALTAAYYSQTQNFSVINFAASVIVGILTSLILFCSHFHQVADDVAAGKKSPVVRLGTQVSAKVLTAATVSSYLLLIGSVAAGLFPMTTLWALLGTPIAWQLCRFVTKNHDRPEIIRTCKYLAVRLHFVSGVLLGIGFIVGKI
jgi:2-carboxy-1,4-naphthoquinone phytyltransferase